MVDHTATPEKLIDMEEWKTHQHKILSVIYPAISNRITKGKEKLMATLDKHRKLLSDDSFPTGSIVMLIDPVRTNKFEPKYIGPYTVTRRSRHGAYVLRDSTGDILDRQVPSDQLKLVSRSAKGRRRMDNVFEVERVVGHRGVPGKYQYHVKWKGYDDSENTWQDSNSFLDTDCIVKYWKHHTIGQSPQ
jgi:hypothetical protein